MIVFIDIDNTLLDFNKCAAESFRLAAGDFGIGLPEDYFVTFKRINDDLWHRIEQKTLTVEGLGDIRFNMIFAEMGISFDGPTFEKRFRFYLRRSAVAVDGAKELVKYLAPRYDVYAASNAPRNQQARRLKTAGMLDGIKGIFISEEIGAVKPSAEFFTKCFDHIGNPDPRSVVMIGDSPEADIIGAHNYGLKTIWFNYDGKEKPCPADYTVTTLSEIMDII